MHPGELLRRPRHRAAPRPHGRGRRHRRARGRARRRRAARLRPAPARHRRRAAPACRSPAPSSPASTTCARSTTRTRSRRGSSRAAALVVIGAGWIGAEVAASARQKGLDVTLVEPRGGAARARARPRGRRDLPRPPPRPRRRLLHRRPASRRSRATAAWSASGSPTGATLDCDFVVVGVGVTPRTAARRGGRASPSSNGILVDERLETSVAGRLRRRRRGQRLPPASTASACASSTGRTRSTRARPPRAACSARTAPTSGCRTSSPTSTTSAWSTPATRRDWDEVVFRGDPAAREFIAFWLQDGRVRRRDERERLGRHRRDPGADPRARAGATTAGLATRTCHFRGELNENSS